MIVEAAYTTCLLLLCCTCTTGTGIVITHSIGIKADVAPVCSGDELELICTLISGRVLEWSVSLMPPEYQTFMHVVDSVTPVFPMHTVMVNGSVVFTFSRISPPNTLPLISRLLISPATSIIYGTEVACADRVTRNSSSTTVNVVHNTNIGTLTAVHPVNFTLLSELRESIYVNLSVSLQLNGINLSFPYHINIIPEERNITVTNVIQKIELRMQYDILYNMSIAVCGESSGPLIGLYYPKCGTSPAILDYDGHLQGTFNNITDCPPTETSQVPQETSTGLEKTSELRSVNVLTVAISSTVVAFLVIIILTFAFGFVCGHCFGRKSKRSSIETQDNPTGNQPEPLYEDVLLRAAKHQEHDLELKENVAYGPSKSIIKSVN